MKAVAIRTVGDAEWGSSMANVLMQPSQAAELAKVKAENEQLRKSEAENGVRKKRDKEYFERKIRMARRKYRVRKPFKVEELMLIGYALAALAVQEGFRRLAVWNRAA